ncbi:MAG TPA: c-type cytochrome [Chitinophagaceae bacterium]|nr:c-type cytochrome [Chitinophagaceae bacterium]
MKRNIFNLFVFSFAALSLCSIITGFALLQKKAWEVPDKYKSMKNPVASNAASLAEGKTLWSTHCKSCHGTKGLGDGSKAAQLKTEPGDFSKSDFQAQTDGELFYKTTEGRGDMPSYKKKLPDADERWTLINYVRTFKK